MDKLTTIRANLNNNMGYLVICGPSNWDLQHR